jgi:hypothetical protein
LQTVHNLPGEGEIDFGGIESPGAHVIKIPIKIEHSGAFHIMFIIFNISLFINSVCK